MSERGFTLVELLVASLISLFVAAGALLLAEGARTAITVEPAAFDTVRRLREGADGIAAAIASAGGEHGIGGSSGTLADGLPVLQLVTEDGGSAFTSLVVTRAVHGGRGQLAEHQHAPDDSLTLARDVGSCPHSDIVCGFMDGDVAAVFDGRGRFDVFVVGAVSDALSRVTPRAPLRHAYRSGASVMAVRYERLVLVPQPDGAHTLSRVTAAGAREPIVDGVLRMELDAWGQATPPGMHDAGTTEGFAQYGLPPPPATELDPDGIFGPGSHCMATRDAGVLQTTLQARTDDDSGLSALSPSDLDDGPWCPHPAAEGRFDADWFRVRRVDVRLDVGVLSAELRGPSGRLFARGGTGAHAAARWVRDRRIRFSVAVGR